MNSHENVTEPTFSRPKYTLIPSRCKESNLEHDANSLIPTTCFHIDICTPKEITVSFISHIHNDHTKGIDEANDLHIFASPITCNLMKDIQENGKLARYHTVPKSVVLHPIEIGELCVFTNMEMTKLNKTDYTNDTVTQFVDKLYPDHKRKQFFHTLDTLRSTKSTSDLNRVVVVQTIPANHCPGSVMFLFEMYKGSDSQIDPHCYFRMLITGDFSYNDEMKKNLQLLKLDKPERKLSLLHCDNTCYEYATYTTRPSKEVIAEIKLKIDTKLKQKPDTKVIFGSFTCKTEKIWLAILSSFEGSVYLDAPHKRVLPYLYPEIKKRVVDDAKKARFIILNYAKNLNDVVEGEKIIFYFSGKMTKEKKSTVWNRMLYGEHCSKESLKEFIDLVKFDRYGCQPKPKEKIGCTNKRFTSNWNDLM